MMSAPPLSLSAALLCAIPSMNSVLSHKKKNKHCDHEKVFQWNGTLSFFSFFKGGPVSCSLFEICTLNYMP
ncbi:hypothetical protein BC939DRAFT_462070 [Gamsiella multidivaricata]|uniref:uncharacterized protein n=1 Tax=Gamsiella multidivaricata TaxID=101098 RepID=UPI00221E7B2B|nr:uncharacterized protein BC939DRAFT_462070 [Gamsiella multidivaricata]KAI7818817.1 hypothetical protein BC939DRAFT_462070 [Gamsiella multidivaricata]